MDQILPWSGSVPAQQPMQSSELKRSITSGFPDIWAIIRGNPATPKLIAIPESPHPQLFADDAAQSGLLCGRQVGVGSRGIGEAEGAVFLEHLPKDGVPGDDVLGVRHHVETPRPRVA